ncbi:hypothetical protein DERF_005225 [Dermatophagoides farinae]|uniref:Uncharacterized protein n=1 Tax=Dermatophagoides farinae TaxID=6954 RepID=A0A922I3W0_DERFA|nr:hypothetical protein DERF_005225 [Dermatophagoides farinae]
MKVRIFGKCVPPDQLNITFPKFIKENDTLLLLLYTQIKSSSMIESNDEQIRSIIWITQQQQQKKLSYG